MPKFLNVFGPGHLFVGKGGGGGDASSGPAGAKYIGTAQRSPRIEIVGESSPAYRTKNGRLIPFDEIQAGEHAFIRAMDMTRFDFNAYKSIAGKGDAGAGEGGDVGAMVHLEGLGLKVAIVFPYMNTGYLFPAAVLIAPEELADITTTAAMLSVAFHAIPHPRTGVLYNNDVGGLEAP